MKIVFHPEISRLQRYSCNCCGRGCRSFLVPVKEKERQAIENLQDWRKKLKTDILFVKHRSAGPAGYGLAKHDDGRCVFLGADDLCLIHKLYGMRNKPLACQLYPFVLTPFAGELRVGLRFDCSAVCRNEGRELIAHKKELKQLQKIIVPAEAESVEPPPIRPGQKVSASRFNVVNEILLKITDSDALPLARRLQWLSRFVEHLAKVKWKNVSNDDLPDLLAMLQGGLLAEIQRSEPLRQPVIGKPRKLLGQIFFLLSHPTTIITGRRAGLIETLRERAETLTRMKQLGQVEGPLPAIQPDWPTCDMGDLEKSFGDWPRDVDEMLTRYLISRIGSIGYCGPNFYNYSMVEGMRTLLLAMITVGWLMRIEAVGAGRNHIELSDAHKVVMIIDGNLGYATALATGPARLRLNYLSGHLENIINWYCT